MQKTAYCKPKGHLSPPKRPSLATRKAAFHYTAGNNADARTQPAMRRPANNNKFNNLKSTHHEKDSNIVIAAHGNGSNR